MNNYDYDYKFREDSLERHFKKHVFKGKTEDINDNRSEILINREKDQWFRKGIDTAIKYKNEALRVINNHKREYKYKDGNKISKNYQYGLIPFCDDVINLEDDEFEKLLTTCTSADANEKIIYTCFYKTVYNRNLEVLSIAYAIYQMPRRIIFTGKNVHIDGFNIEPLDDEYKNTFKKVLDNINGEYFWVNREKPELFTKLLVLHFIDEEVRTIKEEIDEHERQFKVFDFIKRKAQEMWMEIENNIHGIVHNNKEISCSIKSKNKINSDILFTFFFNFDYNINDKRFGFYEEMKMLCEYICDPEYNPSKDNENKERHLYELFLP